MNLYGNISTARAAATGMTVVVVRMHACGAP